MNDTGTLVIKPIVPADATPCAQIAVPAFTAPGIEGGGLMRAPN